MCGRFAVTTDPARLAVELDAVDETGPAGIRPPNYNVAPGTDIVAVVARHDEPDRRAGAKRLGIEDVPPTRRIRLMRWGLVPPWAKAGPDGPTRGPQLINARAETVTTSPAFRTAAQHKRCLIPMDGYYEWKPNAENPKRGRKTPYYFHRPDGSPLMMAGLWSVWRPDRTDPPAAPLMSCTVITTDAVGEFAEVHDRMPLSLAESDWDRWLDPDAPAPVELLASRPDVECIAIRQVSTLVNNVANNGPELIEPAEQGNQPVGLF
jgi:putative SOS response-associated peptidase YedK